MLCPAAFTSAATFRVTKSLPSARPSRRSGIVARGLSQDAADSLARALRASDEAHVYRVWTAPLEEQVELAAAALAVQAAAEADPVPYRLAA